MTPTEPGSEFGESIYVPTMHPRILLLALLCVAVATSANASDVTPKPLITSTLAPHGAFLAASDITVFTVIAKPPAVVPTGLMLAMPEYLATCGSAEPGITLTPTLMDCQVIGLSTSRAVVARIETVFVRASAVSVIDGRPASLYAFPPMAAPGTDGQGAGVLPMPEASGVSLAAGTARIFAGIRTGRLVDPTASKSITPADLNELTRLISIPSADAALGLIQP